MEFHLSDHYEKYNLPFDQIYCSVKDELKSGIDPDILIQHKIQERKQILEWLKKQKLEEWGKASTEKYKKLAYKTKNMEEFQKLLFWPTVTSSAPWALSWVQYNIGECYEFQGKLQQALDEYKKCFELWIYVNGWNGNGPGGDSFKRSLVILSKLKDKFQFTNYHDWFLNQIHMCPIDIQAFYTERIITELGRRMAKVK